MMTFETYLTLKIIAAVVGTLVLFPLCMWWLNRRENERKDKREQRSMK
jgi:hypothetical protein